MSTGSVSQPYESPIAGYIAFARREKAIAPITPSQEPQWREIKVVSTENSGSPFASARCTDGFIPSMLAAKNYVDLSVAGKKQGAAVEAVSTESAEIVILPGVKTYIADFSEGSEAVSLTFDLTGMSGAFEFDLWVTPAEEGAVSFPASVIWFDSMGPGNRPMLDSEKRYLFHFDSLDGETLYGRYIGQVDKAAEG